MTEDDSDGVAADTREVMIWNERRKLEALFLNNLAVGVIMVSVVTPAIALLYELSNAPSVEDYWLAMFIAAGLTVGIGLHRFAGHLLEDLR